MERNFLILNEESNAQDYLMRSHDFLKQIDSDSLYIKWFIIAFHGAVYSYIILHLHNINSEQIFKDKKINNHSMDRDLISYMSAYSLLKKASSTGGNPYIPKSNQDAGMKELNDKIRNLMMHFRPMVWAVEPWYPSRVCYSLIDILKYSINNTNFIDSNKNRLLLCVDEIEKLLNKYRK